MRFLTVSIVLALFSGPVAGETTLSDIRPQDRPVTVVAADFQSWISGFRSRARQQGISEEVLETGFKNVRFEPEIVRLDRNQAEFTKTIWDYLGTAVSDARVTNGKKALRDHGGDLDTIEAQYGVPKEIVTAIWGLESAYGAVRGDQSTISALATLAFDSRRSGFFEAQLMAALQILQAGDVQASAMRGSWAGAMGHTQFMPVSYLEHAVDFDGDGRRSIWGDNPVDALASTAAYLKNHGWVTGVPWGVEVQVPDGFDYLLADREIEKPAAEWAALGVRDMQGNPVQVDAPASILLPAGASGAAFMIFKNFEVLERYNTADAYVIGVGHLADRISGGASIRGGWPTGDRALSFDERIELQERLTAAGFDTVKIDGKIGPLTIASVRGWQQSTGRVPDGYASPRLLDALRVSN